MFSFGVELAIVSVLVLMGYLPYRESRKCDVSFLSIEYTTIAKGIFILMVVIHHTTTHLGFRQLTPLGGVGVAGFLMVSGYGLMESYKKKGLKSFWRNKVIRVMIPYWIIISIFNFYSMSLPDFIRQFFFVGIYHWFVTFIIGSYIVFYLTQRFIKDSKMNNFVYIFVSILIVLLSDNIKAEQGFSFYMGILISRNYEFFRKNRKSLALFAAIVGFSLFAFKQLPVVRTHDGDVLFGIVQLFIKLPLALVVLLLIPKRSNWSLDFTGKTSWEIYLIHCSILGFFYVDKSVSLVGQLSFYAIVLFSSYMFYLFNSKILNKLRYV